MVSKHKQKTKGLHIDPLRVEEVQREYKIRLAEIEATLGESEREAEGTHRTTWVILKAFVDFVEIWGAIPTNVQLAALTGLTPITVNKYMGSINYSLFADKVRALTPYVILAMFQAAINGDSGDRRLWLQFVEKWNLNDLTRGIPLPNEPGNVAPVQLYIPNNGRQVEPTSITKAA